MVRRLVVCFYALLFVDELVLLGLIPLAPTFADEFNLSETETGLLLASASISTVAVAVPAGVFADRIGSRRLTLAGTTILGLGALGQGFADTFATLLAGRLVFGAGSAILWTAGTAWVSDSVPERRRSAALGAVMTVAGVGATVGPVFAGSLAEHVSLGAPFIVSAVMIFVLTAVLATAGPGGRAEHERLSLLGSLRAARLDRLLLAGLVITMLAGLADGVVGLLAPLQLDENGLSAGAIGAVFSASAAVFLVCSVLLVRAGDRVVTLGAAALGALALALTMTPLLISISTGAVTAGVLLRTVASAVLYTISFPLATRGAYRVGLGRGTALGLANLCWGMSTLVGPIAAGALAETVGARVAYVGLAAVALGVAAWLFVARAREADSVAARAAAASAKMRP